MEHFLEVARRQRLQQSKEARSSELEKKKTGTGMQMRESEGEEEEGGCLLEKSFC